MTSSSRSFLSSYSFIQGIFIKFGSYIALYTIFSFNIRSGPFSFKTFFNNDKIFSILSSHNFSNYSPLEHLNAFPFFQLQITAVNLCVYKSMCTFGIIFSGQLH